MKNTLAILFVAFFGIISGMQIKFEACDSPVGHINSVDVTPCPTLPCEFPSGADAAVKINFTSNVETKNVKAVVHGYVFGIPVPFSLPEPEGCNTGIKCPVKAADRNLYANVMPISKSYPRIKVGVKWELRDDKGRNIACFKVPIRITKS